MGIDRHGVRFLCSARQAGVDFDRTLTLGRQDLHVAPSDVQGLLREYGYEARPQTTDELFELLGASHVNAMDVSDYENATIIHDLNEPVDDNLKQRYTAVIDGGTLEHVFNVPVALKNSMEMVAPGGHLIIFTPTNNFFGHGFYQFSPELFYRALSPANGYQVERVVATEVEGSWYEVADPAAVRQRVELINNDPVYLLVLARRVEVVPIFERPPQQSDYATSWTVHAGEQPEGMGSLEFKLRQRLKRYDRIWQMLRTLKYYAYRLTYRQSHSFANRKIFRPVDR